ncbi:hypothetical protein [Azospirillum melinis]
MAEELGQGSPSAVGPHRTPVMIIEANRPYSPKCEEEAATNNSIKRGISGKNEGDLQLDKKKARSRACGDFDFSPYHPEIFQNIAFARGYLFSHAKKW